MPSKTNGMSGTPSSPAPFSRAFYALVSVRFLGSFSVQLQAVILGWQMYQLTRDPLYLGLIGLAEAVPAISLALFAGYIVDRTNPKRIILAVIVLSLVSVLLAWIATTPTQLFVAAFLTGIGRSFHSPAYQSLLPRLVPKYALNRAIPLGTSAMKLAYVTGPAVGGILLGLYGTGVPYALGSSFLSLAIVGTLLTRYDHAPYASKRKENAEFMVELLAGLRFVFRHRLLLAVLSLDMFAVLFGGVTAMLPMIAEELLHAGPEGLGLLRASPAVGAVFISLWLVRFPISRNAGRILIRVVAGFGVCILAFGVSRNLPLSCAILALAGGLDGISMVIRGSIVQLCSPEAMRGRIAAVNSIFIGSSNEIGAFESGVAAKLMGLVPSIFFGGAMTLLTVAIVSKWAPELRKVDLDELAAQSET